jgi:hypothetical protein
VYLSHYFIGLTCQDMGDRAGALAAFERAVAIAPGVRSGATMLAVELLLGERSGNRERAYELLQRAHAEDAPPDPWHLYKRGDARLWPTYMAMLREALR